MKNPRTVFFALILALLAFVATAARSDQDPAAEAADLLRGVWEGSSPGNTLLINVLPGAPEPTEQAYSLPVTIIGKKSGTNVNIQGVLRFQREGTSVRLWWTSTRGGCDIPLAPAGDGFQGEAMPGVCATAFQQPVVGKWLLDFDGVNLKLSRADTGETLRFKKKPSKTPTP